MAKNAEWCPQHGYPLPCHKCGVSKLDQSRLVTEDEVGNWMQANNKSGFVCDYYREAQDAKTASIKEQEFELRYNPDYLDFQKGVKVERELCQARIGALVELIGDLTDSGDCVLDHHGDCQSHGYTKPCPMPEAQRVYKDFKATHTSKKENRR